jgi:hypothetical protein
VRGADAQHAARVGVLPPSAHARQGAVPPVMPARPTERGDEYAIALARQAAAAARTLRHPASPHARAACCTTATRGGAPAGRVHGEVTHQVRVDRNVAAASAAGGLAAAGRRSGRLLIHGDYPHEAEHDGDEDEQPAAAALALVHRVIRGVARSGLHCVCACTRRTIAPARPARPPRRRPLALPERSKKMCRHPLPQLRT